MVRALLAGFLIATATQRPAVVSWPQLPATEFAPVALEKDVGGPQVNQQLSESRALAVQKYLVEHGVEAERLQAQGFGMSKPLLPNTNEANRAKNRRVQFRIVQ